MNIRQQTQNYARLALVGALHAGLILALLQSMKIKIMPVAEEHAIIYDTPKPPPPEPKPTEAVKTELSEPPLVSIAMPKVEIELPVSPPVTTHYPPDTPEPTTTHGPSTGSTDNPGTGTPITPVAATQYSAPVVDMSTCEKPQYPNSSIRVGEEGTTTLAMHISSTGQVIETRIERSSGFRGLDRAAQTALARCSFKPGSRNGVSEASWARVDYVWKLD